MLGIEIGESFRFKSNEIDLSKYEYRLTEKQLEYYCEEFNVWYAATFKTICNLLNGEYEVVKLSKPILSENEKEYLSYVIKPFRHRIKYFYKWTCADCDTEIIMAACKDYSHLEFPSFEKNAMYKGMEPNKKYTLDDLGL